MRFVHTRPAGCCLMARAAVAAALTSDSTLMAAAVPVVCCFSICEAGMGAEDSGQVRPPSLELGNVLRPPHVLWLIVECVLCYRVQHLSDSNQCLIRFELWTTNLKSETNSTELTIFPQHTFDRTGIGLCIEKARHDCLPARQVHGLHAGEMQRGRCSRVGAVDRKQARLGPVHERGPAAGGSQHVHEALAAGPAAAAAAAAPQAAVPEFEGGQLQSRSRVNHRVMLPRLCLGERVIRGFS